MGKSKKSSIPTEKPTLKICVLGDGAVGKSALTIRYFMNQFVTDWDPTIEDLYQKEDQINNQFFHLSVQDTAGQDWFKVLREDYIKNSQGFLIVYSVAEPQPDLSETQNNEEVKKSSFQNIRDHYDMIRRHHPDISTPIQLVANKVDLRRHVSEDEGRALANELNVKYIETSALRDSNVKEAFQEICTMLLASLAPKGKAKDKKKFGCSIL